jgi:hypothetical protein
MKLPPFFTLQFLDDDGTPLAGGFVYTYASGTTTPQATYTDQAGTEENANPIVLDAAGRCDLWLDDLEYTFLLKRSDLTTVKTWDDVSGAGSGADLVTSVNTFTGVVELTADDIPFTTSTTTDWFAGTDITAALDGIITFVDDLAAGDIVAANIPIVDAGGLITATNVETAFAEIAAKTLPSQTTHSGKWLKTNGTAASWETLALPAFTASVASGNITTSVASGQQTYGTRTVTATGGAGGYTYFWVVSTYGQGADTFPPMQITGASATAAAVTVGGYGSGETNTGTVLCFVTDSDGRVTTASFNVEATHAA